MKLLKSVVLPAAVAFVLGACEKQSYSETRAFTHHGEHASPAKPADPSGAAPKPEPAKH